MGLSFGGTDWFDQNDTDFAAKVQEWELVVESYAGREVVRGWNRAPCAICQDATGSDDYKESMGFNTETNGYNCYKCGSKGMLPGSYVEEIYDGEFKIADAEALAAAIEPPPPTPIDQPVGFLPLFSGVGLADPSLEWGRQFLTGARDTKPAGARARQLPRQTCEEAGLGVVPHPIEMQKFFTNRVILPVPDYQDFGTEMKGWVARDATGTALAPYLNAKHMDRERLLFNEPALYEKTNEPVFVVEGPMDALRLWPNAVAVLGKPIPPHADIIAKARRPVVVMLDGDAWEAGKAFSYMLRFKNPGLPTGFLKLPPTVDPDDYGLAQGWDAIREEGLRSLR